MYLSVCLINYVKLITLSHSLLTRLKIWFSYSGIPQINNFGKSPDFFYSLEHIRFCLLYMGFCLVKFLNGFYAEKKIYMDILLICTCQHFNLCSHGFEISFMLQPIFNSVLSVLAKCSYLNIREKFSLFKRKNIYIYF